MSHKSELQCQKQHFLSKSRRGERGRERKARRGEGGEIGVYNVANCRVTVVQSNSIKRKISKKNYVLFLNLTRFNLPQYTSIFANFWMTCNVFFFFWMTNNVILNSKKCLLRLWFIHSRASFKKVKRRYPSCWEREGEGVREVPLWEEEGKCLLVFVETRMVGVDIIIFSKNAQQNNLCHKNKNWWFTVKAGSAWSTLEIMIMITL